MSSTVEVDIELPPDAPESAAPQSVEVFAIEKSGTSRKIATHLEERGPGHWTARGRSAGESIVIVRARDAHGALMAEALGQEAVEFPSHHGGFLGGEFGYAGQPEAFAARLHEVLDSQA